MPAGRPLTAVASAEKYTNVRTNRLPSRPVAPIQRGVVSGSRVCPPANALCRVFAADGAREYAGSVTGHPRYYDSLVRIDKAVEEFRPAVSVRGKLPQTTIMSAQRTFFPFLSAPTPTLESCPVPATARDCPSSSSIALTNSCGTRATVTTVVTAL